MVWVFCVVWISLWLILCGLLGCLFRVLLIVLYTSCLFLFVIIYFVVCYEFARLRGCSAFVCSGFASVLLIGDIRLMLSSFVTFYFVSMVVLDLVSCVFDVLVYGCDVVIVAGWWWISCRVVYC